MEERLFNKIDEILERKKQIILYGVPGVGKTYLARKFVENQNNIFNYKTMTFHQSFAYEEFIEGLKPKTDGNGNIVYEVEDGIFKKICILAIWEVLKGKTFDVKVENEISEMKLNNELILNFYIIINNTNICGRLEDMNVWYKHLLG